MVEVNEVVSEIIKIPKEIPEAADPDMNAPEEPQQGFAIVEKARGLLNCAYEKVKVS